MYAVELFFDEKLDNYVRRKWSDLKLAGISSNMYDIRNIRPHVTLGVYRDIISFDEYKKRFAEYFEDKGKKIELKFHIIGTFPTTGTIFLKPTITKELLMMHEDYHVQFAELDNEQVMYYKPDNWDPHCTIGIGLNQVELVDAVQNTIDDFEPITGSVVEIGLVKIGFEDNKCISSDTEVLIKV